MSRAKTPSSSSRERVVLKRRCAVYTRKSTEEGLDMAFNSLDAQREACEAYVASQKAEGWLLVPDRYDDGGFSGGTLERPALQRLLADIEQGRVDVVVVYKIDRLSRSLMDFAKLVEVFDQHEVTFVSVTQQFNTTTSMGKLTLNILFSFAQFEREVIGERIRDKFAASRRKGMWMGGWAPLGYDVKDRKLDDKRVRGRTCPVDLRAICEDGLGHEAGEGARRRGCGRQARQADRQGRALQDPEQPALCRRGRAQGGELSGRARGHHLQSVVGEGARNPQTEPEEARRAPLARRRRRC